MLLEEATTPKGCSVWTVEKKDIIHNQWFMVRSTHRPRCDAGADTPRGNIYVLRGFDEVAYINTAEVYCPGRGR